MKLKLFTIAQFPVYLHWSILIWPFLILSDILPIIDFLIIFTSLLIHEFAHGLVSQWVGFGSGEIGIWVFGGYFKPENWNKAPFQMTKSERMQLAKLIAAGPVSNLLVAGAAFLVSIYFPAEWLELTVRLNLYLLLFNLFPIPGLDGERLASAFGLSYFSQQQIYQMIGVLFIFGTIASFIWWSHLPAPFTGFPAYLIVGVFWALTYGTKSDEELLEPYTKSKKENIQESVYEHDYEETHSIDSAKIEPN